MMPSANAMSVAVGTPHPARGVRMAGVDGTVDDNRCEHAAHCRDDGGARPDGCW